MKKKVLKIIGRIEQIDLPEWELYNIEAKIDTGAYSSSLHCHHIEEYIKDGKPFVRFNILDPEHPHYNEQLFELPLTDKREVKSSNGSSEIRFFVKTTMILFREKHKIEFSLTDRSEMKYPVLLGRKALKNKYLVDVSSKYLSLTNK